MKNLHWAIHASEEIVKNEAGLEVLVWAVDIQVRHLATEEEAINYAKEIVIRKHYKLRSVLECDCAQHKIQHTRALEVNKDLVKAMKKQFTNSDDE